MRVFLQNTLLSRHLSSIIPSNSASHGTTLDSVVPARHTCRSVCTRYGCSCSS